MPSRYDPHLKMSVSHDNDNADVSNHENTLEYKSGASSYILIISNYIYIVHPESFGGFDSNVCDMSIQLYIIYKCIPKYNLSTKENCYILGCNISITQCLAILRPSSCLLCKLIHLSSLLQY